VPLGRSAATTCGAVRSAVTWNERTQRAIAFKRHQCRCLNKRDIRRSAIEGERHAAITVTTMHQDGKGQPSCQEQSEDVISVMEAVI
jgi:hypothetical protein